MPKYSISIGTKNLEQNHDFKNCGNDMKNAKSLSKTLLNYNWVLVGQFEQSSIFRANVR